MSRSTLTFNKQTNAKMLSNYFAATVLIVSTLLAAPAIGGAVSIPVEHDSHFERAASEVTVKYWDSLRCKTSNSKKTYPSRKCINVSSKDPAVSMQKRSSHSCHRISAHSSSSFPFQ